MSASGAARSVLALFVLVALAAALLWGFGAGRVRENPAAAAPEAPAASGWQVVGRQGLETGAFNQPRGIAVLADGSFIVADRSARVQHFSAAGRPLNLWLMQEHALGNPKGLCALPNGNLLVCDTHYGRVLEMTVAGAIARQWGGPGTEPGQFVHPLACAVDANAGVAYVVEYGAYNDRLQKFKLDGTFLKAWGTFGTEAGQFNRPSGVGVDPSGCVWIADANNHRLQRFDAEGRLLGVSGAMGGEPGQLSYPFDLACAPDGRVYVAEFNNHRVSVFKADGSFEKLLGEPGHGIGGFNQPWSIAFDRRGRLLVSDTKNNRVQILNLGAAEQTVVKAPRAAEGAER